MIPKTRDASLAALWIALVTGCGGPDRPVPRTAAVFVEPSGARARVVPVPAQRGVEAGEPDDSIRAARRELRRATEAQQSFHEADALEALARAEALATAGGVRREARAVLADVGFLRAWLYLSLGRPGDAEREAIGALPFADPGMPDPARYPPDVVALVSRLARTPAPEATLRVRVRSGADATVLVDGRDRGRAPVDVVDLAPGRHFVTVEAPGHRGAAERVELRAGAETTRVYALSPLGRGERASNADRLEPRTEARWWSHPLVWIVAGAAVVGVGVGAAVLATSGGAEGGAGTTVRCCEVRQ